MHYNTCMTPQTNSQVDGSGAGYPEGSMRVERGSTPDGRLLLYFTFPAPLAGEGHREATEAPVGGPAVQGTDTTNGTGVSLGTDSSAGATQGGNASAGAPGGTDAGDV